MPSVFVSFKYKDDNWRVQQILNAGVVEGQPILKTNEWEKVEQKGDTAIMKWIDDQMKYKKCVVVMIGENTSSSYWIKYEIEKAFEMRKPVIAVYINKLRDREDKQSPKGRLPNTIYNNKIKLYESPYSDSRSTYSYIKNNITHWINEAITSKNYNNFF